MPGPISEAAPPPSVNRAAEILIAEHGAAALAMAALAASRTVSAQSTEEAAFWLCVCDVIRPRRTDAVMPASAAAAAGVRPHPTPPMH